MVQLQSLHMVEMKFEPPIFDLDQYLDLLCFPYVMIVTILHIGKEILI